MVPSELNAWAKVRRLWAVLGSPSMETSGLATTWTMVIPAASTNSAARKAPNRAECEAGMNRRHPSIITTSPAAPVRM